MVKTAETAIPNELFRYELEIRHWTEAYVAKEIGAPASEGAKMVGRWKRGIASPTTFYREKLEKLFGKSMKQLGWPGKNEIPNWKLKYPTNPFFQGREDILNWLHEGLASPLQILTGLGGVGKSLAAIEYVYKFKHEYHTIIWLRAANREILAEDFAAIASYIDLPEKDELDQEKKINAVIAWLRHKEITRWLLIFDSADDPEIIKEILKRYIPEPCQGHVILTSRSSATGLIEQRKEVAPLSIDESVHFLLRRTKIPPTEANNSFAKTIAVNLGGLPLALEQAGAYIEETGCGVEGYLERYQTEARKRLLLYKGNVTDHEPVAITFSLTFDQITFFSQLLPDGRIQHNLAAIDILSLFAFLAPDDIPEELVILSTDKIVPIFIDAIYHPELLDIALSVLLKFSLIHRFPDTKTCSVHPLVQTCMRDRIDERDQQSWATVAVQAVNNAWVASINDDLSKFKRYLDHAFTCELLIEQWKFVNDVAATLLTKVGDYLSLYQRYKEAAHYFEKVLDMREEIFQEVRAQGLFGRIPISAWTYRTRIEGFRLRVLFDLVHSIDYVATNYFFLGSYMEAEHLYTRIIKEFTKIVRGDAKRYLLTIAFQGMSATYCAQRIYDKAEKYSLRAIHVYKPVFAKHEQFEGLTFIRFASLYTQLGEVYWHQAKYERTEKIGILVKNLLEKSIGLENFYIAEGVLSMLEASYLMQGKYDEAESQLKEILSIIEKTVGSEHPSVVIELLSLALVTFLKEGDDETSAYLNQTLNQTLNWNDKVPRPAHADRSTRLFPALSISFLELAETYNGEEKAIQAEQYFKRALTIHEKIWGQDHPGTVAIMERYVSFLRKTKREAEATEWETRIQSFQEKEDQEISD